MNGPACGGQSFFVAGLHKPMQGSGPIQREEDNCSEEVCVAAEALSRLKVDVNWNGLPPGRVEMDNESLIFRPGPAGEYAPNVKWQGMVLGRGRKGLRLSPRARRLVPGKGHSQALVLSSIGEVHKLLQGQSLPAPGPGPLAPLYWRDLPLGWVTVKGRRCMWTDR